MNSPLKSSLVPKLSSSKSWTHEIHSNRTISKRFKVRICNSKPQIFHLHDEVQNSCRFRRHRRRCSHRHLLCPANRNCQQGRWHRWWRSCRWRFDTICFLANFDTKTMQNLSFSFQIHQILFEIFQVSLSARSFLAPLVGLVWWLLLMVGRLWILTRKKQILHQKCENLYQNVVPQGNSRTCVACALGTLNDGLSVAFATGSIMGFMVVGFGLLGWRKHRKKFKVSILKLLEN